jgi:[CysO sulfur-carrier protein]-S-L-cysteine hydrolase
MTLRLPRALRDAIVTDCTAALPNEACGVVAGRDDTATRVFAAVNTDARPDAYTIDPDDVLRILGAIEDAGETLLAIYHSHPRTEPQPSPTDLELAFWPDTCYLIVSLRLPAPVLRGYMIRDGVARPRAVVIVER